MKRRMSLMLIALGAVLAGLSALPASASAQVCIPGVPVPGCPPPPPPSPSPGPPPPGGGIPPPPPPPPEPAPCRVEPRRSGGFVGLVSEDVFVAGPNYRTCALSSQAASGVAISRQVFDWASIERSKGRYDFSFYDAYVTALAAHRIRVLPILFNTPGFRASRSRRGGGRGAYAPRRYGDLGRFGAVLVRRYGPRGSFWRRNRHLPRLPIRSWQVWNEPNLQVYWPSGPSPSQYTRLLRATARAIKRADRGAEIVTAGLPNSRLAKVSLTKFVAGLYRAGARSAFDTLAINPYSRSPGGVLSLVKRIRRLMDKSGDRRGRIWVTEFGWATAGPPSRFRVSERGQASRIAATLRSLHRARRRLRVRGAIYYNWRDNPPYPPLYQDFFGLHTGLHFRDGRAKASQPAFQRVATRLR